MNNELEHKPEESQPNNMSRGDKAIAWALGTTLVAALAIGVADKADDLIDMVTNPSYSDINVLGD